MADTIELKADDFIFDTNNIELEDNPFDSDMFSYTTSAKLKDVSKLDEISKGLLPSMNLQNDFTVLWYKNSKFEEAYITGKYTDIKSGNEPQDMLIPLVESEDEKIKNIFKEALGLEQGEEKKSLLSEQIKNHQAVKVENDSSYASKGKGQTNTQSNTKKSYSKSRKNYEEVDDGKTTIKVWKNLVETFISKKDGRECARIQIPNDDKNDMSYRRSFVVPTVQNGKDLIHYSEKVAYVKIDTDRKTCVSRKVGDTYEKKYYKADDLKEMVEALTIGRYEAKHNQENASKPSVDTALQGKEKKVATQKPSKKAKTKNKSEISK